MYFPLVILGHVYVVNWGNFIVFIILTFSRRWNFFQFAHCTNFHSIHVDTPTNFSRIYSGLLINLPKCRIYASVNWVIIGSGNGLSPARDQAIAWTNAGLLSIELPGTNFYEIQIGILPFSFKNAFEMSSAKMAVILSRGAHLMSLTHCDLVTKRGIMSQGQHCIRQWTVACSEPRH